MRKNQESLVLTDEQVEKALMNAMRKLIIDEMCREIIEGIKRLVRVPSQRDAAAKLIRHLRGKKNA